MVVGGTAANVLYENCIETVSNELNVNSAHITVVFKRTFNC